MKANDIIYATMKTRGINQTMLAEEAGLKRQSNVSEMLRSKSLRVDNFVLLLESMGYELVVRDKNRKNKTEWVVGEDSTTEETAEEAKPVVNKIDIDALFSKPSGRRIKLTNDLTGADTYVGDPE